MATTLDSNLKRDAFFFNAMEAFKKRLVALTVFSIAFREVMLEGTNKMVVPYFPLHGTASKDFVQANGYVFDDDGAINGKEVTINKRKYQALSVNSNDWNRQPHLDPAKMGELKGRKLAEDVVLDVMSAITAANFGAAVVDEPAASFTKEDVIDIRTACNQAQWPGSDRGLVLDASYTGNILKDAVILDQSSYGSTGPIREGQVQRLSGFDLIETEIVPANGEDLVGFAAAPSAMLVGFSPVTPEPRVMNALENYDKFTDDETGITLEYREWGDPDIDTGKETLEANYGYDVGEEDALKRVVDTTP